MNFKRKLLRGQLHARFSGLSFIHKKKFTGKQWQKNCKKLKRECAAETQRLQKEAYRRDHYK
jgi:hypothetical protein